MIYYASTLLLDKKMFKSLWVVDIFHPYVLQSFCPISFIVTILFYFIIFRKHLHHIIQIMTPRNNNRYEVVEQQEYKTIISFPPRQLIKWVISNDYSEERKYGVEIELSSGSRTSVWKRWFESILQVGYWCLDDSCYCILRLIMDLYLLSLHYLACI